MPSPPYYDQNGVVFKSIDHNPRVLFLTSDESLTLTLTLPIFFPRFLKVFLFIVFAYIINIIIIIIIILKLPRKKNSNGILNSCSHS